ncbi:hypothetical protein FJT64_017350 [Amphibalanus amphitrite]|uniref:Uncharacterized protein n=1 Tax=Amphibalanus amphitrite TaxID=1232801 RepID=A0A6A4XBY2_AMPAM|nr:hypothetical protein FJT64_017350 [Amphibalanus amphitrite]
MFRQAHNAVIYPRRRSGSVRTPPPPTGPLCPRGLRSFVRCGPGPLHAGLLLDAAAVLFRARIAALEMMALDQPLESQPGIVRLTQYLQQRWRSVPADRLSELDSPSLSSTTDIERIYTELQGQILIDHPLFWMFVRHINATAPDRSGSPHAAADPDPDPAREGLRQLSFAVDQGLCTLDAYLDAAAVLFAARIAALERMVFGQELDSGDDPAPQLGVAAAAAAAAAAVCRARGEELTRPVELTPAPTSECRLCLSLYRMCLSLYRISL